MVKVDYRSDNGKFIQTQRTEEKREKVRKEILRWTLYLIYI